MYVQYKKSEYKCYMRIFHRIVYFLNYITIIKANIVKIVFTLNIFTVLKVY